MLDADVIPEDRDRVVAATAFAKETFDEISTTA
jgi:hypothetical protein